MTGIELAAKALLSIGARPAVEYVQRQEGVIRLLTRLKLAPDVPPTDFQALYAYAMVEYCYGLPAPIVNFFRNEYIREAFRKSFQTGDAKYLNDEADEIKQWNDETGALGRLDYDFRRDLAGFSAVFDELVSRSRSMPTARQEQKIDMLKIDLQKRLEALHQKIVTLPSLDDVQALTSKQESTKSSVIEALGEEMRAWFEAIGYRLERVSESNETTFEWLINVPGRRRYDRIVVLGIAGEITAAHVEQAMRLTQASSADEAWVVSPRRVSRAAMEKCIEYEEKVSCYNFDGLIDLGANFDPYLDWLDREVRQRKVDQRYVAIGCMKEEIGPNGRIQSRSKYLPADGGVDEYVETWIADVSKEHLSILGEFGTGKTWFCLHFAWKKAQQYREAKRRGLPRPRVPLLIPLRDYAKAVSVESLFSEFFFRKHEIQLSGYSAFEYLNRTGRLMLIFDGFDEMAARVDRQSRINNFWELARVVTPGSKVLLTCRSEHFPEASEGRDLLGAKLLASTQRLTGEPPQFEVVELLPFSNEQVREMLSHLTDIATTELILAHSDLRDLMRRPVMSEFVLDALPEISSGQKVDEARVYLYAVRRKMSRDIQSERTFTAMSDKLYFLAELSWEMMGSSSMSLNYREFPARLRACFGDAVREQTDLDHWHHDMLGQSMLIRNAAGDYTPAHRSLLEFFVAFKAAAQLGLLADDFFSLVGSEPIEAPSGSSSSWTSWFKSAIGRERSAIQQFAPEHFSILTDEFSTLKLDGAVAQLLLPMLNLKGADERINDLIGQTRGIPLDSKSYIGGFLASLLVRLNKDALKGRDLSGVDISGAQFDTGSGVRVSLAQSSLQNSKLVDSDLENVDFRHCDLRGADLSGSTYFGLDRSAGSALIFDARNTSLYVGTNAGKLLGWENATGIGLTNARVISGDVGGPIRELEMCGRTQYLLVARGGGLGYQVIDSTAGNVVLENSTAFGACGVDQQGVIGVAFTGPEAEPDGSIQSLEVFDARTSRIVGQAALPKGWVFAYYSPELGSTLCAADDWSLYTLDVDGPEVTIFETGKIDLSELWSSNGEPATPPRYHECAYSENLVWVRSNGTLAAYDTAGRTVAYWRAEEADQPAVYRIASEQEDWWLAHNSTVDFAVVRSSKEIVALNVRGNQLLWAIPLRGRVACIGLSPDQRHVISLDRLGGVVLYDAKDGAQVQAASILETFEGAQLEGILGVSKHVLSRLKLAGASV